MGIWQDLVLDMDYALRTAARAKDGGGGIDIKAAVKCFCFFCFFSDFCF